MHVLDRTARVLEAWAAADPGTNDEGLTAKQEIKAIDDAMTRKDREFLARYGGFGGAMKRSARCKVAPKRSSRKESRLTTIRHGGPCGLRTPMRLAERGPKSGSFYATGERWYHATGLEGGVWHEFWLRCTTAVFVYLSHSAVVIQFESAIMRPRGRMLARTRATPPKTGGSCGPKSEVLVAHSFRPA